VLEYILRPNLYRADLWDVLGIFSGMDFWKREGRTRPRRSQALIPNMMYFPRVYAKTQFKSKSLKPIESAIKETTKEMVRYMLVIRKQKCEAGDGILESRDSK